MEKYYDSKYKNMDASVCKDKSAEWFDIDMGTGHLSNFAFHFHTHETV